VLDVERGIDIDSVSENFLDVQIALGMAAAGCIRMRKLVDKHQLGLALQDGVEIHFGKYMALVRQPTFRNLLEALGEQIGFDSAVRFDYTDHGIHAVEPALAPLHQHLISLADARRGAEKHFQPAAALFSHLAKQRFGGWPAVALGALI